MINGESYPSYVVKTSVDDTGIFEDKAWSSKKTSGEIAKVETELNANLGELINDAKVTTTNTFFQVIKLKQSLMKRTY